MSLIPSGGLPFRAKADYILHQHALLCYIKVTPGQFKRKIKLERNDPRMFGWMCNVRPEDRIFAKELKIRLKITGNLYRIKDYSGLVIRKNGRECLVCYIKNLQV